MIAALRVVEDPYLPAPHLLKYPRKGPYYQRRLKKLKADPRNWSPETAYRMGDSLLCRPGVAEVLKLELARREFLPSM